MVVEESLHLTVSTVGHVVLTAVAEIGALGVAGAGEGGDERLPATIPATVVSTSQDGTYWSGDQTQVKN